MKYKNITPAKPYVEKKLKDKTIKVLFDEEKTKTQMRGICMKRKIINSKPEYDKVEFDYKKSKAAQKTMRRKMPTSLTLPPETVEELKAIAKKKRTILKR
jgi:hypothetical protein